MFSNQFAIGYVLQLFYIECLLAVVGYVEKKFDVNWYMVHDVNIYQIENIFAC